LTSLTTLPVPARLEEDTSLRPVPWRRMAWVIWRQHRIALGGVSVFLGALALYVRIVGLQLHHAHAAAIACNPSSSVCADLITKFNFMNHVLVGGYVLQIVPALIGAFAGAPVLARELESGTFRFAWTQGFGRWRWTLAKLVALAVVVAIAAGALSALLSWYYQPYLATGNQALDLSELSPFSLGLFDLRGISFAAWTLVAFVMGALAGMLIRRVVPAIVATLVGYTGLALVAANVLRRRYLTPLLTTNLNVPGSAWIYRQWWTKGGRFAFFGWRDAPNDLLQQCRSVSVGPLGKPSLATLSQCFAQHGYTQLTSYQPAGRFWSFQWIEGGWLLALSVLLIAVTVWLVRRRAT
jgi:ABC-type transport system involved in multi-copper enzyme maturation permease subunit